MDLQRLKALIDLVAGSAISELEIVEGDTRVRIVRQAGGAAATVLPAAAPREAAPPVAEPVVPAPRRAAEGHVVVAPMFGVLHLTTSPGAPPLVEVGQLVRAGQRVAIIEAMKVFNDVTATADGRVAEILVAAGQEVESGQPLLRLA